MTDPKIVLFVGLKKLFINKSSKQRCSFLTSINIKKEKVQKIFTRLHIHHFVRPKFFPLCSSLLLFYLLLVSKNKKRVK